MPRFIATLSAAGGLDPVALSRTALDFGFDGLAYASPLRHHHWESLSELLPRGSAYSLEVFLPLPAALGPGASSPFELAAERPEERREAERQALATVLAAERQDVACVHLPPVALDPALRAEWRKLRAGTPDLEERQARLLARRAAAVPRKLDALRRLLGCLAGAADRYGRRVLVMPGGFPDEAPSPREAQQLLDELRGAPLGLWLDTLRAHVATDGAALAGWKPLAGAAAATLRDFTAAGEPAEPGAGVVDRNWAAPLLEAAGVWAVELSTPADAREALAASLQWLRGLDAPPAPRGKAGLLGI